MKLKFYNSKKILFFSFLLVFLILYIYAFNKYDLFYNLLSNKNINSENSLTRKLIYSSINKSIDLNDIIVPPVEEEKPNNVKKVITEPIKKNNPIIYIYNTHDTESYLLPFVSDYSITPNVKLASYILKDYLNDYNIESTVENKTIKSYLNKNKLDYSYSYLASRNYIKNELSKYDYKILIDLHRDSARKKQTLYEKDDKKYARIMFVLGNDYKTYKENQKFMENLNERINKKYKGLSRGIFVRKTSRYNQDLSNRAILVELGGVDNTLEEINNTLEIFAKILYEYIKEEIYGRN